MKVFWKNVSLDCLTRTQWESLCDGCARCCLVKLEDRERGHIHYTRAACEHLDLHNCRCSVYGTRRKQVQKCWILTPDNISQMPWLPATCAYRCLHEGRPLPDWHPLVTGNPDSVHLAGVSVKSWALCELYIHHRQLTEMIIDINAL